MFQEFLKNERYPVWIQGRTGISGNWFYYKYWPNKEASLSSLLDPENCYWRWSLVTSLLSFQECILFSIHLYRAAQRIDGDLKMVLRDIMILSWK